MSFFLVSACGGEPDSSTVYLPGREPKGVSSFLIRGNGILADEADPAVVNPAPCPADEIAFTDSEGETAGVKLSESCQFEQELPMGRAYEITFLSAGKSLATLHFDTGIAGFSSSVLPVGQSPFTVDLGAIRLREDFAIASFEPLDQIDSDNDGVFDRQDLDDDSDGLQDDEEPDCDLDGIPDDFDEASECTPAGSVTDVPLLRVKPAHADGDGINEEEVTSLREVRAHAACSLDISTVTAETFRVVSHEGEAVSCEFLFFSTAEENDAVICRHENDPFFPDIGYSATIDGLACLDGRAVAVQSWSWRTAGASVAAGDHEDHFDQVLVDLSEEYDGPGAAGFSSTGEETEAILEMMTLLEEERIVRDDERRKLEEEERKKRESEERRRNREEERRRNNREGVVSFVSFGDWGTASLYQLNVSGAIAGWCETRECEFVLTLGDNFYETGVASVDDDYWKTRYQRFYGELALPFYAILGNHDMDGNEGAQIDYSAKDPSWRMPGEFYSIRLPQSAPSSPVVEIFAINSSNFNQTAQGWLRQALTDSRAVWKILAMHHPLISNGPHKDDSAKIGKDLLPIICNRIDLILSGHDHIFSELRQDMGSCGVNQLIIGTGGASLHLGAVVDSRTRATGTFHGFGWFEVGPEKILFRMVGADGTLFHSAEWKKP